MLGDYRGRVGAMARDAVTWLALGLGLVALYAYKDELMPIAARVVGELLPGSAMTVERARAGSPRFASGSASTDTSPRMSKSTAPRFR